MIGIAIIALAQTSASALDDARADTDTGAQVSLGQEVYRTHCASCHGANLEGEPDWRARKPNGRQPAPPQDETGHTWHHSDTQLFRIIKVGPAAIVGEGYESDMPGFDGVLSDGEIWAVLAFIKSRWPALIRARQENFNRTRQE